MQDSQQTLDNRYGLLDEVINLAQSAAQRIERLQQDNMRLAAERKALESAEAMHAADARNQQRRIAELELALDVARDATVWCAWFDQKYGDSIFYGDIQRAFDCDFPVSSPISSLPSSAAKQSENA